MSTAPVLDRFSAAGEYELHRDKVLAMLERRFPRFDRDDCLELYHSVWTTVLEKRRDGKGDEIENLEAYLMGGVDKLAFKRLTRADARRRRSFDPLEGEFAELEDAAATPEEQVVSMDEARRAREVIESLSPRERDVIKLRFDLQLDASEIRARLGLNERQYRRLIERASAKIVERIAELAETADKRRRSLLQACLAGLASEQQLERARRLLAEDPKARATLREMRRATRRVAAALPLPVLVEGDDGLPARLSDVAAATREQLADALGGAKQQAASLAVRASDPTPLAGARPGALAAAVAGCIAAGGGAYCAVQGVPDALKPAFGIEQAARQPEPEPQVTKPPPAAPDPVPAPAPPPPDPVAPSTLPATPAPEPAQPAPPPDPEFFGEAASAQASTPSPGPESEPAPAPAPASQPAPPAPANGPEFFGGP